MINLAIGIAIGVAGSHGYWLTTGRTLFGDIATWWRNRK